MCKEGGGCYQVKWPGMSMTTFATQVFSVEFTYNFVICVQIIVITLKVQGKNIICKRIRAAENWHQMYLIPALKISYLSGF